MVEKKIGFAITGREPWLWLGTATLVLHLLFNHGYGWFRDELYFVVCGNRPAWGYVDQPPLIPLLASWSHAVFGNFLIGFRLVPALAMSTVVALTAEFARALGGGRYSQLLSGLCALAAPYFLTAGMLFTTDTFQPLSWLACGWFLLRLEQTKDERWWVPFGAVVGLSLLSKYLIAFYLAALAIGLLATPLRRSLKSRWLYVGALLGVAIVLPNLLWQEAHGWPFLELSKSAVNGKNVAFSPVAFFVQQLLFMGPAAALVWIAGLLACIWRPKFAVYRAFLIAYVAMFVFFVLVHGKPYFIAGVYPTLFAIGAVAVENRLSSLWRGVRVAIISIAGFVTAPFAIPLLSEQTFVAYATSLGLEPSAVAIENQKLGVLPQPFADMHGWPEMAAKIAAVYRALPAADRTKAVFFGRNYGEAAAIDVLGRPLGLPPAISGHNNYFLWGPQGHDGSVVIVVGGEASEYLKQFASVQQAGSIDTPYAMPSETNLPIYVLRGLKVPLTILWPRLKHYD